MNFWQLAGTHTDAASKTLDTVQSCFEHFECLLLGSCNKLALYGIKTIEFSFALYAYIIALLSLKPFCPHKWLKLLLLKFGLGRHIKPPYTECKWLKDHCKHEGFAGLWFSESAEFCEGSLYPTNSTDHMFARLYNWEDYQYNENSSI